MVELTSLFDLIIVGYRLFPKMCIIGNAIDASRRRLGFSPIVYNLAGRETS